MIIGIIMSFQLYFTMFDRVLNTFKRVTSFSVSKFFELIFFLKVFLINDIVDATL